MEQNPAGGTELATVCRNRQLALSTVLRLFILFNFHRCTNPNVWQPLLCKVLLRLIPLKIRIPFSFYCTWRHAEQIPDSTLRTSVSQKAGCVFETGRGSHPNSYLPGFIMAFIPLLLPQATAVIMVLTRFSWVLIFIQFCQQMTPWLHLPGSFHE